MITIPAKITFRNRKGQEQTIEVGDVLAYKSVAKKILEAAGYRLKWDEYDAVVLDPAGRKVGTLYDYYQY